MKQLDRDQMRYLKGGLAAPSYGDCSATAYCGTVNGSPRYVTLNCSGFGVSCTAIDYGSPTGWGNGTNTHGYSYCSTSSGGLQSASCNQQA